MPSLTGANFALYLLLSVLAWLIGRSDRGHRPLAAYFSWMAGGDLLRFALRSGRENRAKPYSGLARLSFHVEELLVLSWYFLFIGLCLHYFARRRPWPALAAWLAAWAYCCASYPAVSREVLAHLYKNVALAALVASWALIAWGIVKRRELEPRLAHLVLILYATTDVALNLVPLARDFDRDWPLVELANFILLVTCCAIHGAQLLRRKPAATSAA